MFEVRSLKADQVENAKMLQAYLNSDPAIEINAVDRIRKAFRSDDGHADPVVLDFPAPPKADARSAATVALATDYLNRLLDQIARDVGGVIIPGSHANRLVEFRGVLLAFQQLGFVADRTAESYLQCLADAEHVRNMRPTNHVGRVAAEVLAEVKPDVTAQGIDNATSESWTARQVIESTEAVAERYALDVAAAPRGFVYPTFNSWRNDWGGPPVDELVADAAKVAEVPDLRMICLDDMIRLGAATPQQELRAMRDRAHLAVNKRLEAYARYVAQFGHTESAASMHKACVITVNAFLDAGLFRAADKDYAVRYLNGCVRGDTMKLAARDKVNASILASHPGPFFQFEWINKETGDASGLPPLDLYDRQGRRLGEYAAGDPSGQREEALGSYLKRHGLDQEALASVHEATIAHLRGLEEMLELASPPAAAAEEPAAPPTSKWGRYADGIDLP